MSRARARQRVAEVLAGEKAERVPYEIRIRELEVLRAERLARNMIRVTLGGASLDGFITHVPIEHVRLIFPDPDTGLLRVPVPDGDMLDWPRPFPTSREYTVRRHDAEAGELDLDFVVHPGGVASQWAEQAERGQRIPVAGPPGGWVVPPAYGRYLLAGDATALPAIARFLERMPRDARGWAFLEAERIELAAPDGVEVRWVDELAPAVRSIEPPDGQSLYAWVAGEAGAIKPLRPWLRDELGLAPADFKVSGYWKRGETDYEDD